MPPVRYRITRQDAPFAHTWIGGKLKNDLDFPTEQSRAKALRAFSAGDAKSLNVWCEKYLSPKQWSQMRAAVRQFRSRMDRRNEERKTITISKKAWRYVTELAERDESTISDAMEKYLYRAMRRR